MEAYIYTYVNRETNKTYIGARQAYKGSCYDDFNIKYFSSSKDKEFRQDMADGKLDGQIVLVMNADNANKKIFEIEAKMIEAYWDKYGKENSYNHYANGNWNKAGIYPWNKGGHHTEEARVKMSAHHADVSGSNNPNYGCHKLAGENNPNYGKRGILSPNFGKHRSKEAIRKTALANKGRKCSEEYRRKVSEAHKGKALSEEHRRKISDSKKGILKQKFRYITENGDEVMMDKQNVVRWHSNWIKID